VAQELQNLLELLIKKGAFDLDYNDEIVKGTAREYVAAKLAERLGKGAIIDIGQLNADQDGPLRRDVGTVLVRFSRGWNFA